MESKTRKGDLKNSFNPYPRMGLYYYKNNRLYCCQNEPKFGDNSRRFICNWSTGCFYNINKMKKIIYLLFIIILYSCNILDKNEEPEYAYAYINIEASLQTKWDIGLISSGEDIYNTFIFKSDDFRNYQKLIYKNKPFGFIIDITNFDKPIVIKTTINEIEQEILTIETKPNLPLLIIYANGDINLAHNLAKEIEFNAKVVIIK